MFNNKIILLTGGTGSFGQKFIEVMLKKYNPKIIRIFSRDELKQWEMQRKFNNTEVLRFFIGDIRDKDRLHRAIEDVDIVVHAAALKQVPACEYNPFEAVKTNIGGAQNIIDIAIEHNIPRVIALSTDKAVSPINLYGATKLCMERLFIAGNSYVGSKRQTKMSCVRYGNVVGSRGSVIPLFKEQRNNGKITITHDSMTRFWLTLEQGVKFVIKCIEMMHGGEIFVPKIPSMRIVDMAEVIAPGCKIEFTGIRPGEKLNECLLTDDEARHAREFEDFFVIESEVFQDNGKLWHKGKSLPEGFKYSSEKNDKWLTKDELQIMVEEL